MFVFNVMIIVKTMSSGSKIKRHPNDQQAMIAFKKKQRMSISLITISALFIFMTLPATIYWGYFGDILPGVESHHIGGLTDTFSFLNSTSVFFTSYFTNLRFQRNVNFFFARIFCKKSSIKENTKNQSMTKTTKQ